VFVRLIGAVAAALALAVALPAVASAALSRPAQRVYDDYRSDAAIVVCDHTVADYRRTLREITPAIEEESPAFRPAVEAALQDRREGKKGCKEGPTGGSGSSGGGGASTGISKGGSVSPPKAVVPPVQPPAKPPKVVPAKPAPVAPAKPAPTAQATPAPTVAPPPPVASSAPAPAKEAVLVDRPHEGTPAGLLIALGLLALALVCALLALVAGRFGLGGERLAGARHAWGEAAYRATGTWADFVDWVRLGR
jgi:outer membrane biosynthesis protein TonB